MASYLSYIGSRGAGGIVAGAVITLGVYLLMLRPSAPAPKHERNAATPANVEPATAAQPNAPAAPDNSKPWPDWDWQNVTELEDRGRLKNVHDRWAKEDKSIEKTREASAFWAKSLTKYHIKVTAEDVSCKVKTCRAVFSFATIEEIKSLARVPHDDRFDAIVGEPEPGPAGPRIVIYWAQKGELAQAQ